MALRPKKTRTGKRKKLESTFIRDLNNVPASEKVRIPRVAFDVHAARMTLVDSLEEIIQTLIVGTHDDAEIVRALKRVLPVIHRTQEEGRQVAEWVKEQG